MISESSLCPSRSVICWALRILCPHCRMMQPPRAIVYCCGIRVGRVDLWKVQSAICLGIVILNPRRLLSYRTISGLCNARVIGTGKQDLLCDTRYTPFYIYILALGRHVLCSLMDLSPNSIRFRQQASFLNGKWVESTNFNPFTTMKAPKSNDNLKIFAPVSRKLLPRNASQDFPLRLPVPGPG